MRKRAKAAMRRPQRVHSRGPSRAPRRVIRVSRRRTSARGSPVPLSGPDDPPLARSRRPLAGVVA
jgi:hypothetical protein